MSNVPRWIAALSMMLLSCTTTEALPTRSPTPPSPQVAEARAPRVEAAPALAPASEGDEPSSVRETTEYAADRSLDGAAKSALAFARKTAEVTALFEEAGVAYPPAELYFRVFKQDKELEVWANGARGDRMKRVAVYRTCAMSGDLGPKRAEGDGQVPEGFYKLSYFWPDELFHLAAKVDYPNAFDKARGYNGGDIMIHGGCASIGCIAMGDERIEELWVMGEPHRKKGLPIDVTIYPARHIGALLARSDLADRHEGWRLLEEALDQFEASGRPPALVSSKAGLRLASVGH